MTERDRSAPTSEMFPSAAALRRERDPAIENVRSELVRLDDLGRFTDEPPHYAPQHVKPSRSPAWERFARGGD